jgi:hypothetical protein
MKRRPAVKVMASALAIGFSLAMVSGPFAQQGDAVAAAAGAETAKVVAHLKKVEGDILASTKTGLVAVGEGAALRNGIRVMTMAKATANIEYEDGCVVELKPNMRVEVKEDGTCDERIAMAQQVVLDPATELALEGALETPTASIPALVLAGGLGSGTAAVGTVGVAAIIATRPDDSVSPN